MQPQQPQTLYFTILVLVWWYLFNPDEEDEKEIALPDRIIKTGERFLGAPYQFGAKSGQTANFDCSSFVQYVYGQNGITLPRTSRQQSLLGITIPRNVLRKADLLFFKSSIADPTVRHVGIYAGNDLILHIWNEDGVHYESLSHSAFDKMYLFAKRVIE